MFFSFKCDFKDDLAQAKIKLKENLLSDDRRGKFKIKFFWEFVLVWYWGKFEMVAQDHQGKDYFVRTHILSIASLKNGDNSTRIKGFHIVNILDYLAWFLLPFSVSMFDGNFLYSLILSTVIMLFAIFLGFGKDKDNAQILTNWMQGND